jgi:excisionase family DNA binding protein
MVSFNPQVSPVVVNNHISVKAASEFSGYSLQYLRRLLRCGKLAGLKIGQIWLIDRDAFLAYFEKALQATDQRFGPQ